MPKDAGDPKGEPKLKPVYEFGEEKSALAIGSTFKLYASWALSPNRLPRAKQSGDDKLAIKEAWKRACPAALMQNEPDGKGVPRHRVHRENDLYQRQHGGGPPAAQGGTR